MIILVYNHQTHQTHQTHHSNAKQIDIISSECGIPHNNLLLINNLGDN